MGKKKSRNIKFVVNFDFDKIS
uniref:Uncharacterized protein n=1 Tax=Rhizophora mucronata TaxID=61149 RepID=A0A2P2P0Q5_RHIMU